MSIIDRAGNLHRPMGEQGAGQFAGRMSLAPESTLTETAPTRTYFIRTPTGVQRTSATSAEQALMQAAANGMKGPLAIADHDIHVSAQAGPILVQYDWEGDGYAGEYDPADDHDEPLLRLTVFLEGVRQGSWCTATAATADPDLVCSRAVDAAAMLAGQVRGQEPAKQQDLMLQFLSRSADVPDPIISRPVTPAAISAAYPERHNGVVMGFAVVQIAGGRPATPTPFPHQDDAAHRLAMLHATGRTGYEVRLVPVTTADGQVVRDGQ